MSLQDTRLLSDPSTCVSAARAVDIHATDGVGRTPFLFMCFHLRDDAAKILWERGSRPLEREIDPSDNPLLWNANVCAVLFCKREDQLRGSDHS